MPRTQTCEAAPPTLDHVIGQSRAVRQLRTALEAHHNDRAACRQSETVVMPHILLVGPPGCGKSLFASIVPRELGSELHEALGQNISFPPALHGLLAAAESQDCLFIDEIHELSAAGQTILYRALEEQKLFLLPGPDGKREVLDLPPLTMLAATTDEWALTKPLRDRFKIILRLEHYSTADLTKVVEQRSKRLGWSVEDEVIRGIAERSRGVPRLAIRLLESCRRTSRAEGSDRITTGHFLQTCDIEGIDPLGLDMTQQHYLQILQRNGRQPIRLNLISMHLGLPRRTIESVIEPDLFRLGLLTKSDAGRTLTSEGQQHLKGTTMAVTESTAN